MKTHRKLLTTWHEFSPFFLLSNGILFGIQGLKFSIQRTASSIHSYNTFFFSKLIFLTQVWPLLNPHGFLPRPRLSKCLLVGRFSNGSSLPSAVVLWSVHRHLGSKSGGHGSKLLLHSYRWPQQGTQVQTRANPWRVRSVLVHQVSKIIVCVKNKVNSFSVGQTAVPKRCNFLLHLSCTLLILTTWKKKQI